MIQDSLSVMRRQFLGLTRILSTITELVSGAIAHQDETSLLQAAADLLLQNHNFHQVTVHKIVDDDVALQFARSSRSLLNGNIDETAEPFVATCTVIARQHLANMSNQIVTREVAETFFYSAAISIQEELIGIVTVSAPSFDENHAKFLPVFATTLASLLLNVRYRVQLNGDVQRRSDELEIAWDMAKKSDAAKSQFLTNVSHEYLTPLNSINSASALLIESELNQEQTEFVKTIIESTRKLSGMVGGTLDYVLSETGELTRAEQAVDLAPVLQSIVGYAQRLNTNRNLSIQFHQLTSLPRVEVDQKRITQILNHLISNAVKFTAEGTVVLEARLLNVTGKIAEIVFLVRDTGMGIAVEDQPKIFNVFHQLNGSSTRPYEGTGLGLALCQRIANVMGSEIKVQSEPGIGSTFSLHLKLEMCSTEKPVETVMSRHSPVSVLLVEDNLINQRLAARLLEKMGCQVDIANDGIDAVNKFSESSYDLVFMDCQMPNMDGYEATSRIRELETDHRTPIIALTANCLPEDRARSLLVGMDEFLTKPVVKEQLREALSRWSPPQTAN